MLAANKTNTNIGVGLGIILLIVGQMFLLGGARLIVVLIGEGLFIWGCMNYAEGKGHSKWLGLLGLLSCLGLIILIVLPDRNKVAS